MKSEIAPPTATDHSSTKINNPLFTFATGSSLGQWKLVAHVARGSHAEVYRASPLDRGDYGTADYALKVARPDINPVVAKRLLSRQLLAASSLPSPEIIPVLAADLDHSSPHIVMPFIPGCDLNDWQAANSMQPLPVLLWIARQIAQGLKSMHQLGWLHGDLQPANILIN